MHRASLKMLLTNSLLSQSLKRDTRYCLFLLQGCVCVCVCVCVYVCMCVTVCVCMCVYSMLHDFFGASFQSLSPQPHFCLSRHYYLHIIPFVDDGHALKASNISHMYKCHVQETASLERLWAGMTLNKPEMVNKPVRWEAEGQAVIQT